MDFLDAADLTDLCAFEKLDSGKMWDQLDQFFDSVPTPVQEQPTQTAPKRSVRERRMKHSEDPIVKPPLEEDGDEEKIQFGRKRKRGRGPRVKDKKKHNEAETQRRRRMKTSFAELAKLCGLDNPTSAHKAAVLRAAIAKVKGSSSIPKSDDEQEKSSGSTTSSDTEKRVKDKDSIASSPSSIIFDIGSPSPSSHSEQEVVNACKTLLEENGAPAVSQNPFLGLMQFAEDKKKEVQELVEYKKRAEGLICSVVQLLKQQINYHSVFNCSSVAEDIVNFEGRIVDCNILLCRLLGYSKTTLLNPTFTFYSITHPDSIAQTCLFIQAILSGRSRTYQVVKKYLTSDGRGMWVRVTAWLARDELGKPQCIRALLEPFAWGDSVPPLPENSETPMTQTHQLLAAAQAAQKASAVLTAPQKSKQLSPQ